MEEYVGSLLGRYGRRGILVDTNLLLLYFVGLTDPDQITRFCRTRQRFAKEDFYTLQNLLERFSVVVTTPHILTEVSNFLGRLGGELKTRCLQVFARAIPLFREQYAAGEDLAGVPQFIRFGNTDVSILDSARSTYLVLTDDLPLSAYLQSQGVEVLNFNNIRTLNY